MPLKPVYVLPFVLSLLIAPGSAPAAGPAVTSFSYSMDIKNVPFVPVVSICSAQGISAQWDGVAEKVVLTKDGSYLTLLADEPVVNLNGVVRPVPHAPTIRYGTFLVPETFPGTSWWPWKESQAAEAPAEGLPGAKEFLLRRIMIDPGHGGHDEGAHGVYGILEKELVLDFSLKLASQLRTAGFDVFLTRVKDEFITLEERANMVGRVRGDLFLSIHANASENHKARGFEVYYLSEAVDDYMRAVAAYENSVGAGAPGPASKPPLAAERDPTVWDIILSEQRTESILLARMLSRDISRARLTIDRGIKSAEFRVLKNTNVPALLIELGFITNAEEARRLIDPVYQRRLILGFTQAILEYKDEYERTRGFTV